MTEPLALKCAAECCRDSDHPFRMAYYHPVENIWVLTHTQGRKHHKVSGSLDNLKAMVEDLETTK
jgi:hypothetical protein